MSLVSAYTWSICCLWHYWSFQSPTEHQVMVQNQQHRMCCHGFSRVFLLDPSFSTSKSSNFLLSDCFWCSSRICPLSSVLFFIFYFSYTSTKHELCLSLPFHQSHPISTLPDRHFETRISLICVIHTPSHFPVSAYFQFIKIIDIVHLNKLTQIQFFVSFMVHFKSPSFLHFKFASFPHFFITHGPLIAFRSVFKCYYILHYLGTFRTCIGYFLLLIIHFKHKRRSQKLWVYMNKCRRMWTESFWVCFKIFGIWIFQNVA